MPVLLKSSLQSIYVVGDTYALITGLSIKIPEDGYYIVSGQLTAKVVDTDGPDATLYYKLAVNSNNILASGGAAYHIDTTNAYPIWLVLPIQNTLYLKTGQTLAISIRHTTGDSCNVYATNSDTASYLEAVKVG